MAPVPVTTPLEPDSAGGSTVGHWRIAETLSAVASVIGLNLATYLATQTRTDFSIFYTNSYFIALTGIIAVSGNYLFNRLRYREFRLRCELDANQRSWPAKRTSWLTR
jgi:hypothetical protein